MVWLTPFTEQAPHALCIDRLVAACAFRPRVTNLLLVGDGPNYLLAGASWADVVRATAKKAKLANQTEKIIKEPLPLVYETIAAKYPYKDREARFALYLRSRSRSRFTSGRGTEVARACTSSPVLGIVLAGETSAARTLARGCGDGAEGSRAVRSAVVASTPEITGPTTRPTLPRRAGPTGRVQAKKLIKSMVGVTGFEPATPTSRRLSA
jgi:hypothetical protein